MAQLQAEWFLLIAALALQPINTYDLRRRRYLGPTSMDTEMAFLMCNMAQASCRLLCFVFHLQAAVWGQRRGRWHWCAWPISAASVSMEIFCSNMD